MRSDFTKSSLLNTSRLIGNENNNIFLITSALIVLVLFIFFNASVVTKSESLEDAIVTRSIERYPGNRVITFDFSLRPHNYLLLLEYPNGEAHPKTIVVNGKVVKPILIPSYLVGEGVEKDFVYLPKTVVIDGANSFKITFEDEYPIHINYVLLKNYVKSFGAAIYIFFSDAPAVYNSRLDTINLFISLSVVILTILFCLLLISRNIKNTVISRLIFPFLPISFSVFGLCLALAFIYFFKIVITPIFFLGLSFDDVEGGSFVFCELALIFLILGKHREVFGLEAVLVRNSWNYLLFRIVLEMLNR